MRHHTTDPVRPVAAVVAVSKVDPHRRDVPARAIFAQVQSFYRRRLRIRAQKKTLDGGCDSQGA